MTKKTTFAAGVVVGYLAAPLITNGAKWIGKKALGLFLIHKLNTEGKPETRRGE